MNECAPLGKEWSFAHLINCSDWNPVKKRIASIHPKSVLDLGCGDAILLFLLYHAFGITHLEGIDNETEDVLIERWNSRERRKCSDRFDAYRSTWSPDPTDVFKEALTRDNYKEFVHLKWGHAPQTKFSIKQYDIIIMDNLLHYLNEADCSLLLT